MKTDYSELVGKTLIWRYTNGKEITAAVDGCDYSIGITILELGNPEHRLCCYNGPLSPVWKNSLIKYSGSEYRQLFHRTIKDIKAGLADGETSRIFRLNLSPSFKSTSPTAKDCAFAQ